MEPGVEPVGEFTRDEFGGVDDGLPGGNAAARAVPEGVREEGPIGPAEVYVCSEGDEVEGAVAEGLAGARDVGEGGTEDVSAGVNRPVDGEGREPGEVAGTPSEGLGGKFEVAGSGADGVGSVDVAAAPGEPEGISSGPGSEYVLLDIGQRDPAAGDLHGIRPVQRRFRKGKPGGDGG